MRATELAVLIVISIIVVILLIRRVLQNTRRLDESIETYRKEQESQVRADPYSALSDLFDEEKRDK
jgi:hypothetical protein